MRTRIGRMVNSYWNNKSAFHLHVHLCLGQLFHTLPCKTQDQTYLGPCNEISLNCWALGSVREHHSVMEPIKKKWTYSKQLVYIRKCSEVSKKKPVQKLSLLSLWSSSISYCAVTCPNPSVVGVDTTPHQVTCLLFSEYISHPNPISNKACISQHRDIHTVTDLSYNYQTL